MGALDEMEAQRGARPSPTKFLQKALRSKASNRVYRRCLPPENPAGHRKANRRVTEMHHPHAHPQFGSSAPTLQGRNINLSAQYRPALSLYKAHPCYRSGTEVIEVTRKINGAGIICLRNGSSAESEKG